MAQADFVYDMAADAAGLPLAVSIFADADDVRCAMQEDVVAAGFATRECGTLDELLAGDARALGDLTLVDCPRPDLASMAALARLDSRVAHAAAKLIVSTSVDGLEDVFAACAESGVQILVDPTRAERVIALGRMLAEVSNLRLRELSETDRLALLRLTEQVGKIAERLDQIDKGSWGRMPRPLTMAAAVRFASRVRLIPIARRGWSASRGLNCNARFESRCPARGWFARSSLRASCAPASSMESCSPIRRGTRCWT